MCTTTYNATSYSMDEIDVIFCTLPGDMTVQKELATGTSVSTSTNANQSEILNKSKYVKNLSYHTNYPLCPYRAIHV